MSERKGIPTDDPQVIGLPVKFSTPDEPFVVEERRPWTTEAGCAHRNSTYDEKARTLSCTDCKVALDPLAVLVELSNYWRRQNHIVEEIRAYEKRKRQDGESHLSRVKKDKAGKYRAVHNNCVVHDGQGHQGGMPGCLIETGDYVARNKRYRARRDGERWVVAFWDTDHGLKDIETLSRAALPGVRQAVRDHWRRWEKNKLAGRTR
jgi:hypothetical protein